MAQQITIWLPAHPGTENEEFVDLTKIADAAEAAFPGRIAYLVEEVADEDNEESENDKDMTDDEFREAYGFGKDDPRAFDR